MSMTTPYLAWTLRAIARMERDTGRSNKPPRLTEPDFAAWHRIQQHLGWVDFIGLLHDDMATAFPVGFSLANWTCNPLADLAEAEGKSLIDEAIQANHGDTMAFLRAAAADVGLPAGGSIADLPKVQPFHKVLELPGSAGRIAAHQVLTHSDLSLDRQFILVADSDAERLCIGLAAAELRSNPPQVLTSAQAKDLIAGGQRLDRLCGVPGSPAAVALGELARGRGHEVRFTA